MEIVLRQFLPVRCGHGPEQSTPSALKGGVLIVELRLGLGVVGMVEGVFLYLFGPRLDLLGSLALLLNVRHAVRDEDTHYLVHRDSAQVFRHKKVHEVVGVGQALGCPPLDGDLAV